MPKLRVHNVAVSLDGYAAGPSQSLERPLGAGGERLHEWIFKTRYGLAMLGQDAGESGIDDDFLRAGDVGIGATIIGRNMFGPIRGPWGDDEWRGWWGDEPPYHHPVFVLTHHARDPLEMAGGTTFHFVTDGIEPALHRAFEAADGKDVRLGGGAATVRQYMEARLVDDVYLAVVPTVLGSGERIFSEVDADKLGYQVVEHTASPAVLHVHLTRTNG